MKDQNQDQRIGISVKDEKQEQRIKNSVKDQNQDRDQNCERSESGAKDQKLEQSMSWQQWKQTSHQPQLSQGRVHIATFEWFFSYLISSLGQKCKFSTK